MHWYGSANFGAHRALRLKTDRIDLRSHLVWASQSTIQAVPQMKYLALALCLVCADALSFSVYCKLGTTTCIKSQGTHIPSKTAIDVLDRCEDFISNDIGRVAMRLSYKEINERTQGRRTPLSRAWHAYGDLIDSPLRFERKAKAEESMYGQIKRACLELNRDFNDDLKWTR